MALRVEENIAGLVPYVPGKPIEELKRELGLERAIKLASNENPLGPSPKAVEVIREMATSMHIYPDGGAYYLKEALAERLGVSTTEVLTTNGSNEAIELLVRTLQVEGGTALLSEHSFIIYKLVCQAEGVPFREVAMTDDLRFDLEAMAEALDPSTRFVFIANPNNPTGTCVSRAELEAFLRRVPEEAVVVLDEAYFEFVSQEDYPDGLELRGIHPNLVVLRTFSKVYGLAGLRVGYAVASEAMVNYLNRVRAPFNCNAMGQAAAVAALSDEAFLTRIKTHNARELSRLQGGLEALGLPCTASVTNFALAELPVPAVEVFEALLERGLIVRPMAAYGLPRHIRVSVGLEEENTQLLEGLAQVLEARGGQG